MREIDGGERWAGGLGGSWLGLSVWAFWFGVWGWGVERFNRGWGAITVTGIMFARGHLDRLSNGYSYASAPMRPLVVAPP